MDKHKYKKIRYGAGAITGHPLHLSVSDLESGDVLHGRVQQWGPFEQGNATYAPRIGEYFLGRRHALQFAPGDVLKAHIPKPAGAVTVAVGGQIRRLVPGQNVEPRIFAWAADNEKPWQIEFDEPFLIGEIIETHDPARAKQYLSNKWQIHV